MTNHPFVHALENMDQALKKTLFDSASNHDRAAMSRLRGMIVEPPSKRQRVDPLPEEE